MDPIDSAIGSPIEAHIEYLPPTQSQNPKTFSFFIPNSFVALRLVDNATMLLLISLSVSLVKSQFFAVLAFVIVSIVVNVFEAIRINVLFGSSPDVVSRKSLPSTFEIKCKLGPSFDKALNAFTLITGPKSDPPIPMLITSVNDCP